ATVGRHDHNCDRQHAVAVKRHAAANRHARQWRLARQARLRRHAAHRVRDVGERPDGHELERRLVDDLKTKWKNLGVSKPEWWKHLRENKRVFWHKARRRV